MNTRRYVSALVAATVTALVWTGGAEAQKKQKIAILGLEVIDAGAGIDASTTDLANKITEALRDRPGKMAAPYQIAPNSNKDLLEMKLLSNCSSEAESCMADIGKELGADLLLYGKIQKLSDGYQVTLTRLDVGAKSKQALTAKLGKDDAGKSELITKWCTKHYIRIMGLPEEGTLVLNANVDSGTVFVDRESKGSLVDGKARIKGIKAGKREVAIEAAGHKRFTKEVEIEIGETMRMSATLEVGAMVRPDGPEGPTEGGGSSPSRPGGIWRISTWGLVGVTAATGTLAFLQGQKLNDSQDTANETFANLTSTDSGGLAFMGFDAGTSAGTSCAQTESLLQDTTGFEPAQTTALEALDDACKDGDSAASNANLLIGVTVVAGLAAVASFYLGYIASPSASSGERASRSKKPDETTVQIAPVVTPTYTGGAVRIEF